MAYHIVIRKNGKQHGLLGPYATKPAADADANVIKVRLSAPASVVVERVKVGGVTYVPQGGGAPTAYTPPPLRRAAGGVVINDDGFILVREPTNHFDGYVWTLPKGGVDAGETDEQGAVREVLEETGIRAEVVAPIPGEWKGGTSTNVYFLMQPVEDTGEMDDETENIAFVSYDDAKARISKTKNAKGKARDLEVLDAGYGLWLQRRQAAAAAAAPKRNRRRNSGDGYRMRHRPPEDGPLAYELGKGDYMPADVLIHPEWYTGFQQYLPSFWPVLRAAQRRPQAMLRIYRALPKPHATFREGDWVTLSLDYAKDHLESNVGEGGHIIVADVPASTLRFAGDDLMEWGYWGPTIQATVAPARNPRHRFA